MTFTARMFFVIWVKLSDDVRFNINYKCIIAISSQLGIVSPSWAAPSAKAGVMSCPFYIVRGLPFFLSWLVADGNISGDGKFVQFTGYRSCRLSCNDSVRWETFRGAWGGGELLACGNSICICVTSDLGTLLNPQDTLHSALCVHFWNLYPIDGAHLIFTIFGQLLVYKSLLESLDMSIAANSITVQKYSLAPLLQHSWTRRRSGPVL